jgi:site-specific DNA-methyltransferase (adenine-specific)
LAKAKDYKAFAGNDLTSPSEKEFKELFRVTKNQIIWGANHFISKIPFDSSCWIVWNKDNGNNDFADCELAWTSFFKNTRQSL